MTRPVALLFQPTCDPDGLDAAARALLAVALPDLRPGERVLVKPNLVAPANPGLSCTHPQAVRAVCRALLEAGAAVEVADSPAFGSAASAARACGLGEALRPLGLRVLGPGRPVFLRLSCGARTGVSSRALAADRILSLAKVKAHRQMRVSLSVKNLFGCVVGFRKALAHHRFGDDPDLFCSVILDVFQALPPVCGFLEGVTALHEAGPIHGRPLPLGLLAASPDPMLLDAAVARMLGIPLEDVPLWRAARKRGLPGTDPDEADYPLERPERFAGAGFRYPQTLTPLAFRPMQILKGRMKSLAARWK